MLIINRCINFRIFRCYAKKPKENIAEMKYLNVAEKNDAAKTIAGQLSNGTARRREGYSVYNKIYEFESNVKGSKSKMVMTSVSGHLLQLEFLNSYRNWQNCDPQALFEAPIQKGCNEQYQPIKRTLEREVRSCNGLIIWTDCDREGENIGFEIIDVCRSIKPNIVVYRAIFSEITSTSVKRALQNLTMPDKRQSDAVDVRTELDLRTGAAITRFQTMRLQKLFPEKISDKLISYGSCQIPTLGFVVERYKEIEDFVSEPFWKINVTHTIDDLTVQFQWARNRLFDKQECEDYFLLCISNPKATVQSVTVKPKSKWRPTPMDTVELEKLGSRKLKLSAKEVMTIAEKLYTKGIISYPRTETNMFSKEIDLGGLVQQQTNHGVWGAFAERVVEWGPNPRNGTKSDQAHPPIHPTKMVPHLEGNEGRVYELICRHFLACVSKDAIGSETIVTITIEGEKFTANGLVIFDRNYLDVYIYDKWNAKQIHKYEEGKEFEPTEITMPEGHTTAPPLLTEADLIVLMEKHGIGTDATHAEHINTIKERGYIGVVDNGSLVPGVIGMGLCEGYDAMELALAKPILRAEFESDLKKVCLGEKDPKVVLREQVLKYKEAYKQIMNKVTAMDEKISQRIQETPRERSNADANSNENNRTSFQELFKCPKCCTAPLALKQKNNKTGYFIGCLNFPNCKHCIWFPDECKDPTVLDEHCPKCGAEYKLIKLKFSQSYHKHIFNSPSGWYKTCIRCDVQFQNTFNINIESVKNMGAIVSDIASTPINYGSSMASSSTAGRNNAPKTKNTKGSGTKPTKSKIDKSTTKPAATSKKSTSQKAQTTTVRSYFTTAAEMPTTTSGSATCNDSLNAFFDSNDGFDDLILAAEANIPSLANNPLRNTATTLQKRVVTVLPADLAAVFNDDDDDFFMGIQTNSTNHAQHNTAVDERSSDVRRNSYSDDSFSAIFQDENDFDEDYVWGTAAKNERNSKTSNKTEPASKKLKIQQLEPNTHESYSWGSSSTTYNQDEATVKCSGCHAPAKELCVKKEGPNKGRIFYVCPKSNSCKFFQWADEFTAQQQNENATKSSNYLQSWGNRETTNNGWGSMNANDDAETINCKCNQTVNKLTVRKDGPNKGRYFYACSNREKSCGFFKWADENENNDDTSWGSGQSTSNKKSYSCTQNDTSWDSGPSTSKKNSYLGVQSKITADVTKGRKCGLCRQEGHSRQKCPRKI